VDNERRTIGETVVWTDAEIARQLSTLPSGRGGSATLNNLRKYGLCSQATEDRVTLLLERVFQLMDENAAAASKRIANLEERVHELEETQEVTNARIASAGGSMLHLGKERVN
jgi:hypothetical protein